jgi:hypothetical protein
VSLTPVANLPPVSTKAKLVAKFAAGVVDTVDTLTCEYLGEFSKIRNGPNGIIWGWGETES